MTNRQDGGIGQRDWLADSRQRMQRLLPAPVLSLRRPGVTTRPTLGSVMQRRASRTIEGIPMGPVAGRQPPLVLRRPIRTQTAPDPMLTLLSPTRLHLDPEDEAPAPVLEMAEAESMEASAAPAPIAPPARATAEPPGGLVNRVFRRLFRAPEPAPDEAAENAASDVDQTVPDSLPAEPSRQIERPAPESSKELPDRATAFETPAAIERPVPAAAPREAVQPAPVSLVARLLRRHSEEPEATTVQSEPSEAAPSRPTPSPGIEAASEALQVPSRPQAASEAPRTLTLPALAARQPASPPDTPLTLRRAAATSPTEPEATPLLTSMEAPSSAEEPAGTPTAVEASPSEPAPYSIAASSPVESRADSASQPAPPVQRHPESGGVPGLFLRLRRLVRPEAIANVEDAPAPSQGIDGPVEPAPPAASSENAAASVHRSAAADVAERRPVTPASDFAAPAGTSLVVRTPRRPSEGESAQPVMRTVAAPASVPAPNLQLQPWSPVFRSRAAGAPVAAEAGAVHETTAVSLLDGAEPPESAASVILVAPQASVIAPAVTAEGPARETPAPATPADASQPGANLDQIAAQIYQRLRRRLLIERERAGGFGSQWQ